MSSYEWPPEGSTAATGITSINSDTTAAQLIVGGTGISVATAAGSTTITNTGFSGTGSGTDNHIVRWDGTTNIQDSSVIILDGGQTQFVAGTAGTPSVIFSTDTTTGFFRPAANQVGVSISGTELFEFNVNGLLFPNTITTGSGGQSIIDAQLINFSTTSNSHGIHLVTNRTGSGVQGFNSGIYVEVPTGSNTAANFNSAMVLSVSVAGKGTSLTGNAANVCLSTYTNSNTAIGHNYGVGIVVENGQRNVGVTAAVNATARATANSTAVHGAASSPGNTTYCAGFFELSTSAVYYETVAPVIAALIADNGGTTADILVARDNATTVFSVIDGGHTVIGGDTTASELRILEASGSGTNYSAFKAQAQAASVTYTLPAADGTSGYQLTTNGSGTLTWAAAGGSIPELTSDPGSPTAESAWVLFTTGTPTLSHSIVTLGLTLPGSGVASYQFSYRTLESTTVRVTLT